MPKQSSKPRRLDSTGTYYAVKVIKGKRYTLSLQTKNLAEATRRWGSAMAQLEEMAAPAPLSSEHHVYWNVETGESYVEGSPWHPDELEAQAKRDEEQQRKAVSWELGIEEGVKRAQRRNGRPPSRAWRKGAQYAIDMLPSDVQPLELKPHHIREFVQRLEEKGYAPNTITARCSILSSIIEAIIRNGIAPDHRNPFRSIDTSFKPSAYEKAKSKEAPPVAYRSLLKVSKTLEEKHRRANLLIALTGCRISEILNGRYEGEWLHIEATKDYQPKNSASVRKIPIHHPLIKEFIGQPWLFFTTTAVSNTLKAAASEGQDDPVVGPVNPHAFRHAFRSAARLAGANEFVVERLLGHSTPGSSMDSVYGSYPDELLKQEIEKVWSVINEWMGYTDDDHVLQGKWITRIPCATVEDKD